MLQSVMIQVTLLIQDTCKLMMFQTVATVSYDSDTPLNSDSSLNPLQADDVSDFCFSQL